MPTPPRPARRRALASAAATVLVIAATASISVATAARTTSAPPPRSTTGTATVTLAAKWAPTPYVLEAVELLAEDSPGLMWKFAEAWAPSASEAASSSSCWAALAASLRADLGLPPPARRVVALALAARAASPKVEMVRSMLADELDALGEGHAAAAACCLASLGGGRTATDAAGLEAALAAAAGGGTSPPLFDFDHVYGDAAAAAAAAPSAPSVVLYGAPGTPCFRAMHAILAAGAAAGRLTYAWRPAVGPGGLARCGGGPACLAAGTADASPPASPQADRLPLPGFAAEFALKSTEYLAMDDAKKEGGGGEDKDGEHHDAHDAVAGLLFPTLRARGPPGSGPALDKLRDHLVSSGAGNAGGGGAGGAGDDDGPVKVWDLKDVGLQAAAEVAAAPDPLAALADVASSFPGRARALTRSAVPPGLRSDAADAGRTAFPPGSSLLLINGLLARLGGLELGALVAGARHEVGLAARLADAGLGRPADVAAALRLRSAANLDGEAPAAAEGGDGHGGGAPGAPAPIAGLAGTPRLDLLAAPGMVVDDDASDEDEDEEEEAGGGGGAASAATTTAPPRPPSPVAWANDLEADTEYSTWPSDLTGLLRSMGGGGVPSLSRNLFTAVLVADPCDASARAGAAAAAAALNQRWPVRVGVLPLPRSAAARAAAAAGANATPPAWEAADDCERIARATAALGGVAGRAGLATLGALRPGAAAPPTWADWASAFRRVWPALPARHRGRVGGAVSADAVLAAIEAGEPVPGGGSGGATQAAAAAVDAAAAVATAAGIARHRAGLWVNGLFASDAAIVAATPLGAGGSGGDADADAAAARQGDWFHMLAGLVQAEAQRSVQLLMFRRIEAAGPAAPRTRRSGGDGWDTVRALMAAADGGPPPVPRDNPRATARAPAPPAPGRVPEPPPVVIGLGGGGGGAATGAPSPPPPPPPPPPLRQIRLAGGASPTAAPWAARLAYAASEPVFAAPPTGDAVFKKKTASPLPAAFTHWVAADVGTPGGRALARKALSHVLAPRARRGGDEGRAAAGLPPPPLLPPARVALVHCPAVAGAPPSHLARLALAASRAVVAGGKAPLAGPARARLLLALLEEGAAAGGRADGAADLPPAAADAVAAAGADAAALASALADSAALDADLAAQAAACAGPLGLAPGQRAVITNGRVLAEAGDGGAGGGGAAAIGSGVEAADLALVEGHSSAGRLAAALAAVVHASGGRGAGATTHGGAAAPPLPPGVTPDPLADAVAAGAAELLSTPPNPLAAATAQAAAAAGAADALAAAGSAVVVDASDDGGGGGGGATPITSPLQVTAVVSPLSVDAARAAPLLAALRSALAPASLTLILSPQPDVTAPPLTSYYASAVPAFSAGPAGGGEDLGEPLPPAAVAPALPASRILTLNLHVPEAWLAEAVDAGGADLDNIVLASSPGRALTAAYELEALLLTGSCVDVAARTREGVTPRGVQLTLSPAAAPHARTTDTLVMSNLGYFQLQAAPRVWALALAPGRSTELFTVSPSTGPADGRPLGGGRGGGGGRTGDGGGGSGPPADRTSLTVAMDSLSGRHVALRLRKRPGREADDVLGVAPGRAAFAAAGRGGGGAAAAGGGWASWLGAKVSGLAPSPAVPAAAPLSSPSNTTALSAEDDPDAVHVFTVASGHMYERLQKIMVQSVLAHTKARRVKFWFIKNYMSPSMRAVLPALAREFGFEYGLVTYKWPAWLNRQTEKQRIIWAYKILFLDVLFPLNLRRVIFADADQIVRADFGELMRMDLKGAPYAYTPFCDSNPDTDGFRFWKGGYWEKHLAGKPYHISALYVVDLATFRATAAGDTLRVTYDQLSRDPASLANLDQDLPNYAQHSVPIFSLPQAWLWCETWCGEASKAGAKTIDLCNNPATKEPKLDAARRIAPEWVEYDARARAATELAERELLGMKGGGGGGGGDVSAPAEPPAAQSEPTPAPTKHDVTEL